MFNPLDIPTSRKREYPDHEVDMTMETSQLMIRSPEAGNPFKRFKDDPWSTEYLCTNPCSPLASVDLESIFSYSTFRLLPPDIQNELARLLPDVDGGVPSTFFTRDTNPVFWGAIDDWQMLLATGELGEQPTLDDTFKDDAFEAYWGELMDREKAHNVAGDSKSITLKDMCYKSLIRENDIMVYKRNFSACKVVVSKSMKVVKTSGSNGISILLDGETFEDFETPTALETKILDHHGKVTKDKRPNGNAFKSIRLFRDGKDMGRLFDIRKDGFGVNSG